MFDSRIQSIGWFGFEEFYVMKIISCIVLQQVNCLILNKIFTFNHAKSISTVVQFTYLILKYNKKK